MSASRPNIQVVEISSPEEFMMIMQLLNAGMSTGELAKMFATMNAAKANEAAVAATRAPSSPMMFRSASPSPVMSHGCGDKVVEAPKPRGCH